MKTMKKVLCIMLSILMAFSCLTVAAAAEGEEKFTPTLKVKSSVSKNDNVKFTLDKLDEFLASLEDGEGIYFPLVEGIIDIDLRDVNGLCSTLDLLKRFIEADSIIDLTTTMIIRKALGQLGEDINLKNWQKGMSRTGDDIAILTGLIGFLGDNNKVVSGIVKGGYDMGIVNDYVDLDEIFGPDGVSGMLKEMIIGMVYDEDSKEFEDAYNTYKDKMDDFIYGVLLPEIGGEYIPGIEIDEKSTIETLLVDIYNASFDKYISDAVSNLDIDLSTSEYAELRALGELVNLKGSTYDLSGLKYVEGGDSLKDQINTIIGNYIKNMVPSYTAWDFDGGYDALGKNIEDSIKFVANASGVIENAEDKTLSEIGVEIALIILQNGDFGAYEVGLEGCETLEEMATVLLSNTAKEMKIGVNYTGEESYLVVIGDILASWAYDNFAFTDTNGKAYRPGGGKDVFEVANYFANYFLFDRAGAAFLGLSTTKTEDIFTKLDKLADYFGENKKVNFSTRNFILGTDDKKGLLDCVFTLDVGALLDLTIVPAIDKAGSVPAVEFIYKSVQYFLNNWSGKALFPAYQKNAFANALSNKSIGALVEALLSTLGSRKDATTTLLSFVLYLLMAEDDKTETVIESAEISDVTATGGSVAPKAVVKANGKTLTQNTDYVVITDEKAPGEHTATIKGIGYYNGEIERKFNIGMGKVTSLTFTSQRTTVTLKWNNVPYADGYNIYQLKGKEYVRIKTVAAPATSYTVSGLESGQEYKFKVKAMSEAYGNTDSKSVTAYTYPFATTNLKVASATDTSVKLSWTKVTGATHYRIEKYNSSTKKWGEVVTTSLTEKSVTGLSGYTSYKFRVVALKKLSSGKYIEASPSATLTAKTALSAPSKLTATYTSTTVTLSWPKVSKATAYQVRVSGGKWISVTKGTSYKFSKLSAGKKYTFEVRSAVKEGTKWIYSSAKSLSQYTGIAKPSKIAVSATTDTTAKLSWSKVSGAKSYEVFVYTGGKWVSKGTTKSTSMTVSKLPSGTKLKFRVRAITTLGGKTVYGDYSSEVTALTLVGKVTGVKATARKRSSITLSWSKTTGATSYEIYRYVGKKWVKVGTTTKTSFTDSKSLSRNTTYQYKVRAVQKINSKTVRYGAYSSVYKAKTTRI